MTSVPAPVSVYMVEVGVEYHFKRKQGRVVICVSTLGQPRGIIHTPSRN